VRVLLVQSWLGGGEPPIFPLGLACVAAALTGHEVTVFDTNTHPRPFEELARLVDSFAPEVVGFSLRNIDSTNKRTVVFYYPFLAQAIDAVRLRSRCRIVVGGSGFSMFAREIMAAEPRIDLGVFLEGEATFPELLERLDAPDTVRGVFHRAGGAVAFTGERPQTDLDAAPLPRRACVPLEGYRRTPEAFGVETKRGCVLDCIYCIYGFLNGKALRLRDPSRVVDDIETLHRVHGVERFTFVDSVFNLPQAHAERVCRELVRRRLPVRWSAWFNERLLTRAFVELAREAGCRAFILSPDGFSDATLARLGKNIRRADILRAHELLRGLDGFEISYNFFKNPPGQSLRAVLALLAFVLKAKRQLGPLVHFEFNAMRVEPHTKLHTLALEEGVVSEGDNLLYPKYYTNSRTRWIEWLFNLALAARGK
jgi:radical SAM superfamily enzyme YgiQ (UPF0313 family)